MTEIGGMKAYGAVLYVIPIALPYLPDLSHLPDLLLKNVATS